MSKSRSAFTLIELLVVIAIIGILATVSVIALNNARAKSRDAKRIADVKQMQTALELYFNDMGRYPLTSEFVNTISSTSSLGTTTYMQIIPSAPAPSDGACSTSNNSYSYLSADGSTYTLSFCVGGQTGSLSSGVNTASPSGIAYGAVPWVCGNQVTVTTIAGHACNSGAPDYDTCVYDTINMSGQCWMKQNMNIGAILAPSSVNQSNNNPTPILEKYCYDDTYSNCLAQGGLYQWGEAMQYSVAEGAQGICPAGWHIPTDAEQNTLDQALNNTTCNALRVGDWGCANAGTTLQSPSGWNGLLAGYRRNSTGGFNGQGGVTFLWSSTVSGPAAFQRILGASNPAVVRNSPDYSDYGFSVRCLRD